MYPELFSFGPFVLKTINVFGVIAFLYASFLFWRKGREEHYREDLIMDAFLLSTLIGLVTARVGFILLHWEQFGFQINLWFDVMRQGGGVLYLGLIASATYLYRFAKKKKWDAFEVLDFWVISASTALAVISLGMLFGGTGLGKPTSLPIGVPVEGMFEPLHPVPVYWAVVYGFLAWYLHKVEYKYRTFRWYRAKRNSAQTGFLTGVFLISTGMIGLLLTPVSTPAIVIFGVATDMYLYLASLIFGAGVLYVRSGRKLLFFS